MLTCGVIGAGVFGGFHCGKYAAHERVILAGIYDPDAGRAAALAEKHDDTQAFASLEALLAACDAVTIANPAVCHGEDAMAALEAGCHALVEKPLACDGRTARALVDKADSAGLQLHAGHQERFVARAAGLFDAPAPEGLSARRFGPASPRGADVSVVMDLMIHDLDLALRLIGAAPERVTAEGDADEMRARIVFEGGAEAEFAAGRRAPGPQRSTRFDWTAGTAEIDWVAKTLHNGSPFALDPGFADAPLAKDSLGANVNAFVAAILDGGPAAAPGREAAAAVALAEQIEHAAGLR